MQQGHLESEQRFFTKKIRHVDLTVAGVSATPTQVLFRPPPGTRYTLLGVTAENFEVKGTVTDAPAVILDNGTDTQNLVASVDLATGPGVAKELTVINPPLILDNTHPLRLKSADGADGSTSFKVNLILRLMKLSQ